MRTISLFLFVLMLMCSCSIQECKEQTLATEFLTRVEMLAASPRVSEKRDAAALIEEGAYLFSDYPHFNSRLERMLVGLKSDQDRLVRKMSNVAELELLQARACSAL